MKKISQLREKALKELNYFNTKTNIEFEGEEAPNFLDEIIRSKSIKEINETRMFITQTYIEALLDIVESLLDSFILVDIREYNEKFMELGDKFDKIFLEGEDNINETDIDKAKKLFEDVLKFYKKLQRNEKNFLRENRKEFYGKILPLWVSIISAIWVGIITLLSTQGVITLNKSSIIWLIGGWFLLVLITIIVLRYVLYKEKNKIKNIKKEFIK